MRKSAAVEKKLYDGQCFFSRRRRRPSIFAKRRRGRRQVFAKRRRQGAGTFLRGAPAGRREVFWSEQICVFCFETCGKKLDFLPFLEGFWCFLPLLGSFFGVFAPSTEKFCFGLFARGAGRAPAGFCKKAPAAPAGFWKKAPAGRRHLFARGAGRAPGKK